MGAKISIEYWLTIVALFLILGLSFGLFATEMKTHPKANLDSESEEYATMFQEEFQNSGFQNFINTTAKNQNKTNPFLESIQGIPVIGEIIGVVAILIKVLNPLWNTLALIWNMPNFILKILGLNFGIFGQVINIVTYIMILLMTIMIGREIR